MKRIIAFCIMALAMMSCVKESISVSEYGQKTLSAKVESNNVTKVGFTDGTAEFFWTKCDKIGVTTTTCADEFSFMTLNDEDAGKASGTFNGTMSGDPAGYAVYPYISDMHSMSGSTLTYYLPKAYEYTSLDAAYANAEGNSHNAPMWGAIEGGSVSFKHLGGVLAFEIHELPANTQNLVFKLTAAAKINGNFTADLSAADPKIITSEATEDTEKSITVTFSTADAQTSGYIYVPVPTGTIGKLKAKVFNGSEEIISANWQDITIERKDIRRATIGNKTIVGGATSEVNSADDVTEALKDVDQGATDVTVEVKNEVAGADNTIEIPSTLQTETTTIVFNTISDDAVITINNEKTGNYSGQVIIEIPKTETIPTIEANIPDGEVYIKQGNVTTLIVSSADNTTIIGSGVAVNELIVKKGNVRIKDGGNVAAIQRSTENSETVYVIYESATAPTIELGEGVLLVSAAEFDLLVTVANGGEITLTSNVVLKTPLVIAKGKTVSIDLNGYTISQEKQCTESYSMISNNGNLTIKDTSSEGEGKISFKDTSDGDPTFGWGSYTIRNEGTLTIENGTIEHLGEQAFATHMICALFQYSGSSTINGGVISTPAYRSARLWKGDMTITNGTFDGQLWVQSVDDSAKLTISGGSFSPNGKDGSSVFVGNVTTVGVHHTVEFNVTGGNFETKIGCKDPSKLTGNRITGGVFTETAKLNTNSSLIAEGSMFERNADGTYTLCSYFAKDNGTLTLLKDVTLSKPFVINESITFDGNGKILTYTGSDRAIDVPANENEQLDVTFKNLTVDCTASYCQRGINYNDDGKLTLDNVTVKGKNVTYALNLPGSSDNAVVTINKCNLSGNIALNVWGENCKIDVTDSELIAVDDSSAEGYAAIKLNNDGVTSAENSIITITGGKVNVTGSACEDSEAISNGTTTGHVNVSETTTVNGKTVDLVATIHYGDCNYSFDTLASAVEYAKDNETVILLRDVTLSEILVINKAITLDGNGKKLTSTAGRAINVSGADGVTIKNLTIDAKDERAINIIQNATNVTIDKVTATAANYAVNVASSASGSVVKISDSDLTGLNVINIGAPEIQMTVTDTDLTCNDQSDVEKYAAIALNQNAINSIVNVNGGNIKVIGDSNAVSSLPEGASVNFDGTTGDIGKIEDANYYINYGNYAYSFVTFESAISKANAGETIYLSKDVTISDILVINKAVTLDGNGHTLSSTLTGQNGRAINVSGANGVTIKNLTINAAGERAINIIQNATNVTIDNVTATSANYTVNVAGSAPNAVVNIKNSTLNGLCTVNVAAKNANVTVDNSTVNCNDNNTTTGESYAALCLGKESIGGKIIATNTVVNVAEGSDSTKGRNGAENGTVTINGSTEDVAVMVAVITYPSPQYHSFTSIKDAIEFAQENDVITLIRDITINELIAINKAITLDLNGKTVTATSKKAFEVYNNATIKNGSIVAANRCVDTRTNVKLSLENVTLTADKYSTAYGNPQPLTIGGSVDGTEVSMSKVTINAGTAGYGIITFVKTSLTATNSNISGYSSLYVKPGSDNSVFNFVGSNLSGSTFDNDVEGNSFSTVAVRANNVTVNADKNSTVKATGNYYYAASFSGDFAGEETTSGVKAKFAGEIEGKIFPSSTQLIGNELKVKSAYASQFSETGYVVSTADSEGLITITATESTK